MTETKSLSYDEMKKRKIKMQEMIMEIYDVRPSTAYEMMIIMSRIAEVANNEYTYGKQDASE